MHRLEQDVETLRNIPLFAGLPTAKLKLIAYTAEVMHFEPGEIVVRQGDPADCVYIIAEGEAEVRLTADDGRELHLGTMGRHTLFGEVAVLCGGRRTATGVAKSRMVTLRITGHVFLDLLRGSPEIGIHVMRIMAKRLENMTAILRGQPGGLG